LSIAIRRKNRTRWKKHIVRVGEIRFVHRYFKIPEIFKPINIAFVAAYNDNVFKLIGTIPE